jgi:hypothetical protein
MHGFTQGKLNISLQAMIGLLSATNSDRSVVPMQVTHCNYNHTIRLHIFEQREHEQGVKKFT